MALLTKMDIHTLPYTVSRYLWEVEWKKKSVVKKEWASNKDNCRATENAQGTWSDLLYELMDSSTLFPFTQFSNGMLAYSTLLTSSLSPNYLL